MGPKNYKKKYTSTVSTDIDNAIYLIIVESPSKCGKIESYLGQNYKCIASKGHIRELNGLKNIDIKNNFKPTFSIIKEKAGHIKTMREIIQSSEFMNYDPVDELKCKEVTSFFMTPITMQQGLRRDPKSCRYLSAPPLCKCIDDTLSNVFTLDNHWSSFGRVSFQTLDK